eukprot:Skav221958  [mRNA]  locus=scaffold195:669075:671080:- [translate_table: standard]
MVLDRIFDRSGLPDRADRDRERPHVLDIIVPERAGGGIVGQGGERIRGIIEELGCEDVGTQTGEVVGQRSQAHRGSAVAIAVYAEGVGEC